MPLITFFGLMHLGIASLDWFFVELSTAMMVASTVLPWRSTRPYPPSIALTSLSRPARRTYSQQFKAEMVAQCLEGSVALASLAIDHGMNPNVLHRWVTEHERYGKHTLQDDGVALPVRTVDMAPANWFAVKPLAVADDRKVLAPTPPTERSTARVHKSTTIEVALAARGLTMMVRWPHDDHIGLARFARELLA